MQPTKGVQMLFARCFQIDRGGEAWVTDPDFSAEGWTEIPRFSLDWWGRWLRRSRFSVSDILLFILIWSIVWWILGTVR